MDEINYQIQRSQQPLQTAQQNLIIKTAVFPETLNNYLATAFNRRLKGDYGEEPYITKEDAEAILGWTKDFFAQITQYLKEQGFIKGKN